MTDLAAVWCPGLPHLLQSERSPAWTSLAKAYRQVAEEVSAFQPDVLVIYSSQWLSVLGTSFLYQANPKGVHVDDNWHEMPDLAFDFKTDTALTSAFAGAARKVGLASKLVDIEGFPLDTGSLVALNFLNPGNQIPVSLFSSWVYADDDKFRALGKCMRETVLAQKKRAVFVACSLLSARYFTEDIDPASDRISSLSDDEWNRKLLAHFEAGDLGEVAKLAQTYRQEVMTDLQFHALPWLQGTLGEAPIKGRVLAYGPIWGTGAAVMSFREERKDVGTK